MRRPAPAHSLAAILALGALLLVPATLLSATAAGAAPNPANEAALDRTVRYLQGAQQDNGGFAAADEPSQITSAWTALALAAAGINPRDQARPGGVDAFAHLASHYRQGVEESECAPLACTTILERELMVVNAAGADPHDFGGVDLVAGLLGRGRPDGSFPHVPGGQPGVNDTIFAVFALAPIREPAAQAAIAPAADWVAAAQHDNGGWAFATGGTRDEVDMTGAAIQALVAAGRTASAAVQEGLAYLRAAQNPDGGFPEYPGTAESNVASTAWAVQAIWAAGQSPEGWRTSSGSEPLGYIESLQEADGHVRWKRSQDLNGIWMTAYATPALGGQAWPIPAAPRSNDPIAAPKPGQGEGTQSGAGVIAGGGGEGAPLFSRPKPQSRGRTPGGARTIGVKGTEARNRSRTRRGTNTEQPTATQTSEATGTGGGATGPEAGRAGQGPAAGSPLGSLSAAGRSFAEDGGGREVTGTLIGSFDPHGGALHFGAPGLHGAGVEGDEETAAIALGGAALLLALGGAGWERRRQEAIL
jgi:prenyltransferase beta subunit